jgi:hypothetical protein
VQPLFLFSLSDACLVRGGLKMGADPEFGVCLFFFLLFVASTLPDLLLNPGSRFRRKEKILFWNLRDRKAGYTHTNSMCVRDRKKSVLTQSTHREDTTSLNVMLTSSPHPTPSALMSFILTWCTAAAAGESQ